jgi:translocon-associated protein subunit gamma
MSQKQKALSKEEEILLQDFSRNVSTKSNALFYGNAFIVSAIPICKFNLTNIDLQCRYLLLVNFNWA